MKERIHKVLANAGVASRRNVEEMVRQGRIAVNGRVMTRLPILIDPALDKVSIDGDPIRLNGKQASQRMYFLLNKPKGVYSTNVAQGEQKRAIDLLPINLPGRVYPVGRLDAESKGLLLLTNDGELTNRLTHPRYGVVKTYRAVIDGWIEPKTIDELQNGVWLVDPKTRKGFKTGRCRIKLVRKAGDRSIIDVILREGRNRQVRRMLAHFGHKVRELTRIKFGPLTLDGLETGEFRQLTAHEVKELKRKTEDHPGKSHEARKHR
jgi:23S rRNA pseudouridine2605 synthase